MAHKTFISYKYSEAQNLRDRIIKALGDDASYYKGETSDSPDLTDTWANSFRIWRVISWHSRYGSEFLPASNAFFAF